MNKPIIIDGVDVSECEFYIQDYQRANNIENRYEHCTNVCGLNGDNYFFCKMNKNCYYKQLQRLKTENEELKNQLNDVACCDDNISMCYPKREAIKPYKKALEEVREIAKELKQTKIPFCEIEEKIQNIINEVLEQ